MRYRLFTTIHQRPAATGDNSTLWTQSCLLCHVNTHPPPIQPPLSQRSATIAMQCVNCHINCSCRGRPARLRDLRFVLLLVIMESCISTPT